MGLSYRFPDAVTMDVALRGFHDDDSYRRYYYPRLCTMLAGKTLRPSAVTVAFTLAGVDFARDPEFLRDVQTTWRVLHEMRAEDEGD